ncbi:hypothetical protein [Mycobacterium sp.]|uniref:hypothetical protein n=1 Tax=Mycobacterium sp. TaxID=1785 RepID=UPI003CC6084D
MWCAGDEGEPIHPQQQRADHSVEQLSVARPGDLSGDLVLHAGHLLGRGVLTGTYERS